MTARFLLPPLVALLALGCDGLLPDRSGHASVEVGIGRGEQRRVYFSDPHPVTIPRSGDATLTLAGCSFALQLEGSDDSGSQYSLSQSDRCEATLREAQRQAGSSPSFVEFADARRIGGDAFGQRYLPRRVTLEGIRGDLFVLDGQLQLDATGSCVDRAACGDEAEMRVDIHGAVD